MKNSFKYNELNQVISANEAVFENTKIATPLVDALENYYNTSPVKMHIPGHSGGRAMHKSIKNLLGKKALGVDSTDDFHNLGTLHPATGAIGEAQKLAAMAFGAAKTFFLLNGSTTGNLALAMTIAKEGEKVIISRNCHKSVISGITISGADPIWAIPEKLEDSSIWGAISPQTIENLIIENPEVKVVWITNPTYEGIISDIEKISRICKQNNIILIVDEAHGSLWKFNPLLPKTSLELGADAVVNSLHKTGGSFSQSSMLHINYNSKINIDEVESNLEMIHTTSPSCLLMASLDAARAYLESNEGQKNIKNTVERAIILREKLNLIPKVKCIRSSDDITVDHTKLYVVVEGLNGKTFQKILEDNYRLEVESSTEKGILALVNIGNTQSELDYFVECINSIAQSEYENDFEAQNAKYMPFENPEIVISPRQAFLAKKENISPKNAIGRISAEVISECPPGVPILVPGEKIRQEHLAYLTRFESILVVK